jgi:hypothetical protein
LQGVFLRGVADYAGSDAYNTANDVTLAAYKVDQGQGHKHNYNFPYTSNTTFSGAANVVSNESYQALASSSPITDGTNGTPRTGFETSPKQIGVYYLIKLYDNLAQVDVYIPPQVPGISAGLVPAQGLDGRTDGAAVTAGKVGEVIVGNWEGQTLLTSGTQLCSVNVLKGNYLVIFDSSVTPSAATRILSPPGVWTGGTAVVVFPNPTTTTAWDWCTAMAGAVSSVLYHSTTMRVTTAGTILIKATAIGGNSASDCKGHIQFIRIG